MERRNNDENPIYYKNSKEMDKPTSVLIEELRAELNKTRGKLYDIKRSYGWEDWISVCEGGLTCVISAMYTFKQELERFEARSKNANKN